MSALTGTCDMCGGRDNKHFIGCPVHIQNTYKKIPMPPISPAPQAMAEIAKAQSDALHGIGMCHLHNGQTEHIPPRVFMKRPEPQAMTQGDLTDEQLARWICYTLTKPSYSTDQGNYLLSADDIRKLLAAHPVQPTAEDRKEITREDVDAAYMEDIRREDAIDLVQPEPVVVSGAFEEEIGKVLHRVMLMGAGAYKHFDLSVEAKRLAVLASAQPIEQPTCKACRGNDADMPCEYPSEGAEGCLRDARLSQPTGDVRNAAISAEIQRLAQAANTAVFMDHLDMRNIMEDIANGLTAMLDVSQPTEHSPCEGVPVGYRLIDSDDLQNVLDDMKRGVTSDASRRTVEDWLQDACVVAVSQPVQRPVTLINAEERKAFNRFVECAEDGEGYDVPKAMMQRLAQIGVVRRTHGNYYETTEFGLTLDAAQSVEHKADLIPELHNIRNFRQEGDFCAVIEFASCRAAGSFLQAIIQAKARVKS